MKKNTDNVDLYKAGYPISWYAVARSKDLPKGGLLPIELFGQRMVIFRTMQGDVCIADRYCAHMGASLARGTVKGNRLVCPYHEWEYNQHGKCEFIPYVEKSLIPVNAQLKTLLVREHMGMIWTFNASSPHYDIPTCDLYENPSYTMFYHHLTVKAPLLAVMENPLDVWHFKTLHNFQMNGGNAEIVEEKELQLKCFVEFYTKSKDEKKHRLTMSLDYYGPSVMSGTVKYKHHLISTFLTMPRPINEHYTLVQNYVFVKLFKGAWRFLNPIYKHLLFGFYLHRASDDCKVWDYQLFRVSNSLVAMDGAQYQFRRFYSKFLPQNQ